MNTGAVMVDDATSTTASFATTNYGSAKSKITNTTNLSTKYSRNSSKSSSYGLSQERVVPVNDRHPEVRQELKALKRKRKQKKQEQEDKNKNKDKDEDKDEDDKDDEDDEQEKGGKE